LDKNIRLDELNSFSNSLAHDIMRNHEKIFADKIRSIRRTSEDIATIAERLEVAIKNAWGSIDKTTSEQGIRLTQSIKETAGQLSTLNYNLDYASSEEFHKTAIDALNRIILVIKKYVPKLHRVLKADVASLNSTLNKLEATINSLGVSLDESPGITLEGLQSEIKNILEKNNTLRELKLQDQEMEESISDTIENEKILLKNQETLLSNEEFRRFQQYEDALKSAGEEIDQFLQPLIKPLRKLERTMSSKESTVDRNAIIRIIENPKEATSQFDAQTIRGVLTKLNDALNHGQIEIEERKRRRAQETILAISRGELDSVQTRYLTLQEESQTAKEKLASTGLLNMSEEMKRSLKEAYSKREQLETTRRDNNRKIEELIKAISKQKTLIESKIEKLSGHKVSITT